MSELLYSATMSLDGFIAGPGGDMSWMTGLQAGSEALTGASTEVEDLMAGIGALLIGNRTFTGDDPNRGTEAEGAFGGTWRGPSVVLTHAPPPEPWPADVSYADELADAVASAKAAAGGRSVNVLGANVAAQCIAAGLLDEILVFVAPILLGDGTRLFEHPGGTNVRLEPIDRHGEGSTGLRFRVAR